MIKYSCYKIFIYFYYRIFTCFYFKNICIYLYLQCPPENLLAKSAEHLEKVLAAQKVPTAAPLSAEVCVCVCVCVCTHPHTYTHTHSLSLSLSHTHTCTHIASA
jgi:hypothetical protein